MTAVALGALLSLADVLAATGGTLAASRAAPAPPEAGGFASVSIDSRTLERGALFVAVKGQRFDGHDFLAEALGRGARAAVVHREAPAPASLVLVRVKDTTQGLSDLARHVRRAAALPVVGVTGSVGKTTTKDMTAHLLAARGGEVLKTEGNLNNQFGLPLTLLRLKPEHTAAVLEMGMSAPGEIRRLATLAEPDVATITRVAPVHLEFFPSVDAIADAKAEILEGLRPGGAAVLNGDDPRLRAVAERFRGRVVWFGRDRRFDVSAEGERTDALPGSEPSSGLGTRFTLRVAGLAVDVALPLAGPHFVSNFLAAAAAAHVLGVTPSAMAEAASSLHPARHRGEIVRLGEGVTLLDDCYNSSPEALESAVVALGLVPGRRRVAILGDMLELGPSGEALHRAAGRSLAGRVDAVLGVGALAAAIVDGAREAGMAAGAVHHVPAAAAAVAALPAFVEPGDAVLVKASRGVKLEAVVDALAARFPGAEA